MEALMASYGSSSDSDASPPRRTNSHQFLNHHKESDRLPPPPLALLDPPNSLAISQTNHGVRVRSFPHVEGNFALHVYIPVLIPPAIRKQLIPIVAKVVSLVPGLHVVDADIPLCDLYKDHQKLEQVVLGREFHISLGRTVPIRAHQIDSVVAMLRQKLQSQRRYWIDFSKWEVFVNDDQTRTFLSIEVIAGGLSEITRQIHAVDAIYRLHNLPEFYMNPRPHISVAWALGDISHSLKRGVKEVNRYRTNAGTSRGHIFTCKFTGIECKVGKKSYTICKIPDE
ncbi:U6 snRNA phosphodiesterase-like protein isoform X2 [Tasmannia lanceolata]|uniref:U6 snRNA phosphodiesterase-like protein isoform X2 n=1 Tax=Tasmannia lanceolata TaxID=3420 RepID=UPI004063727C